MRKSIGLFAMAGFAAMPFVSHAATPTIGDVLTASGITESGYLDGSYVASNRSNSAGSQNDRGGLDGKTDSFSLNQAAITLAKQPAQGFGGLVNLILGTDAPAINGAYGTGGSDFNLTQAYLQYATGGWTLIGGRFVTLAGAEVINSTQDTNASRSLLFNYSIPLVHTGVRATYKFNDMVSVVGGLNNSITGAASDGNKQKTIEAGVMLTPSSTVNASLVEYYDTVSSSGGAVGFGASHHTSVTDLVASVQATKALAFVLNADYTKLSVTAPGASVSAEKGVALYANYQFCDQLKGSLRGEYLKTATAYTGLASLSGGAALSNIKEITYTVDYVAATNFDLLGEVRYDRANTDIYGIAGSSSNSMGALELKALYKF
ncbi:MAG: outer membrane beta-barrel protein [Stenotrophobium sp.]